MEKLRWKMMKKFLLGDFSRETEKAALENGNIIVLGGKSSRESDKIVSRRNG